MTFGDRVVERSRVAGSPICLGIDPRYELLPSEVIARARDTAKDPNNTMEVTASAFRDFAIQVIDITADHVAAVKPQVAFFEAFLTPGFEAYIDVCRHARKRDLLVVADVKRGDIGTTAAAYADAWLAERGEKPPIADAVTINAWLGSDGVRPFLDAAIPRDRGVFVLVKTSNPSSGQLQDLETDRGAVHERLAELVCEWNQPRGTSGYGPVGAVVGATWPELLGRLRQMLAGSILLLPGYGAQGAGAEDVVSAFDGDGQGALVAASRSLTFPWAREEGVPANWKDRVREAVGEMKTDLSRALSAGR